MKVLIFGGSGQLGKALLACTPAGRSVLAPSRDKIDIGDEKAVQAAVADIRPNFVINAAAYTAVDKAESEHELANLLNASAAGWIAAAAAKAGARLVQISTDYVFDGRTGTPYAPLHATAPLGVYGRSKRDGELAARRAHRDVCILRTAWLYSAAGSNFLLTMLRLMAEREEVRVVTDQIGCPTYAPGLATAIWALDGMPGTFHYSDSGVASWYDFAVAIQEEALSLGLLTRSAAIVPIPAKKYPSAAPRPGFSVLDNSETWEVLGHAAPHWRAQLRRALKDMMHA